MKRTPIEERCQGSGLSCGSLVVSYGCFEGRRGTPSVVETRLRSPPPGARAGTPGRTTETVPGINSIAQGEPLWSDRIGTRSVQQGVEATPGRWEWGAMGVLRGGQASA